MSKAASKLVIAIDGPAGAGKSTIASRLAKSFGYVNLESGAMYRALGLKAIEIGVSVGDGPALLALAKQSTIELEPTPEGNRVLLNHRDVSARIRERDVTDAASRVSTHPEVREWMVSRQREMGANGGVIMEGRDIGTVVFPNAEVKIFLDADPQIRERRRVTQANAQDNPARAEKLKQDLRERDRRDSTRAAAPLRAAEDAVHIDSSKMTIEEVIARAEAIVAEKLRQHGL
ncbi:MAG: (d)CMP kinase [Acidobacteria bacterium]|nr:MAG: (d)CMP kinase [Acidobacteriota bacterium]